MNEQELLLRVSRQLKWTNRLLGFFGGLIIAGLIILGLVIWQLFVMFQSTMEMIRSIPQSAADSVNVENKICASDSAAAAYLREHTDLCK